MEEIEELKLKMRRANISIKTIAINSGCYTYAQVRRMLLKGNPTIKELKTLNSIVDSLLD